MRYGNKRVTFELIVFFMICLSPVPVCGYLLLDAILGESSGNQILTIKERAEIGKKDGK